MESTELNVNGTDEGDSLEGSAHSPMYKPHLQSSPFKQFEMVKTFIFMNGRFYDNILDVSSPLGMPRWTDQNHYIFQNLGIHVTYSLISSQI